MSATRINLPDHSIDISRIGLAMRSVAMQSGKQWTSNTQAYDYISRLEGSSTIRP